MTVFKKFKKDLKRFVVVTQGLIMCLTNISVATSYDPDDPSVTKRLSDLNDQIWLLINDNRSENQNRNEKNHG